jgi:hypothetical protein
MSSSEPESVARHAASAIAFTADLQTVPAELIEAKPSLNRTAIGQAIAGRLMFQRQYGVIPKRTVILCRASDSALTWVCEQENIDVEMCT